MVVKTGDYVRRTHDDRVFKVIEVKPRKKIARLYGNVWIRFEELEPSTQAEYDVQQRNEKLDWAMFALEMNENTFVNDVESIAANLEYAGKVVREELARYGSHDRWDRDPYQLTDWLIQHVTGIPTQLRLHAVSSDARSIMSMRQTVREYSVEDANE